MADATIPLGGTSSNVNEIQLQNSTLVCSYCPETTPKQCIKCKKPYCPNHASRLSPQFCQDCFKELSIIIDKYHKIEDEYDEATDSVIHRSSSCKRIRCDGPDWVFYNTAIHLLSDDELLNQIEFHKFMVSQIENTQDVRKVKKNQAQYGASQGYKVSSTKSTTEIRRKREVKPVDVRARLKKQGIPDALIDAMMKAAGTV